MFYDEIKIEFTPVKSINVRQIGHNKDHNVLGVEMNNDAVYYYLDVPRDVFQAMIQQSAIGSWMYRNIKGQYRFIRIR